MDIQKCIKLGDRIQIAGKGCHYATIVERLENESEFYLSTPWFEQKKVELVKDEVYTFRMVCQYGVISFRGRVIDFDENDTIPLIKIQVVSELERLQRRNSFRVKVMLDLQVREVGGQEEQENVCEYHAKTLNISEHGIHFLSDRKYHQDDLLLITLHLEKFDYHMTLKDLKAKVVRCEYPLLEGEQYKIGVSFEGLSGRDRITLAKFIIRSQIRSQDGGHRSRKRGYGD